MTTRDATPKQIAYVRALLREAGHGSETYLGSWAKTYGLTMAERQGRIDQMGFDTASKLIEALKGAK